VLVGVTDDRDTSPALVGAYTAAYLVGAVISAAVLRSRLGDLGTGWATYAAKLVGAVAVSTGVALLLRLVLPDLPSSPSVLLALTHLAVLGGSAALTFLVAARLLRIDEVTSVLATVLRRAGRH
jgi:putative peptidoglycan lipid II flippase